VVGKAILDPPERCNECASIFIYIWRIFAEADLYLNFNQELPQDIFNFPLRRDLIYRLYNFRINLDKFNSKVTRNRAMTHGSRKKMRPQKGQGTARMGDKRAPHLFKGGKAHGAKAKVYSYPLNAKIKINALKALLSAKLAEGRIKIIDSEAIAEGKTKHIGKAFDAHIRDERGILCVITAQ
jgi:large subunit ribosomal protein L4